MNHPVKPPVSGGQDQRPLVLVVEDEPDLRDAVRAVLEDEGFRVETASDGQQALERAGQIHPELVVLDMSLPRLSGEEVAAGLWTLFAQPPPIVVMSAAGAIAERAQRVGAATYVAKPFDLDDLTAAVRKTFALA